MTTFLEFYIALMKFINHKLYADLGLDPKKATEEAYLNKVMMNVEKVAELQEMAQKKFSAHSSNDKHKYQVSEEFKETPEMKKLSKKEVNQKMQKDLFKSLTFFLNRETPVYCLQYLIVSFGGQVLFEDTYTGKQKVTHHIMDRPMQAKIDSKREYIQPQWIIDSLNNLHLLPCQPYKPGVPPPPHLSPFIDNSKEGYVPQRQKEIGALKGEEMEDEDESESEDEEELKKEEEKIKPQKKSTEKKSIL